MDKEMRYSPSVAVLDKPVVGQVGNHRRSILAMKKPATDTEDCIKLQIREVIRLIAKKYNKSVKDARIMLLNSETYAILQDSKTGLWGESKYYILDYFDKELRGIPREER